MNNRKRMIARVYRQNPTLSTRYHFERIAFTFGDGLSKALRQASECLCKFAISVNEAVKAFDWSEFAKQIGRIEE